MMAKQETALQEAEPTYSQRFTAMIVREFGKEVGRLELNPHQQRLAQHMFIGIDAALKKLDADRIKKNLDKKPIVWSNVNMDKLAIDAVHRIELGLDALIENHIHPVPYLNSKTGIYDLDLTIGYVGKDYYKRKYSLDLPVDIIYQLVHETDTFKPIMKKAHDDIESYKFDINNPFDRGKTIGGFGYIMFENPTKNKLIIVTAKQFDKAKAAAKTKTFWEAYSDEMKFVVLVRRVTAYLKVDPEKLTKSYAAVEMNDNSREISENANQDFIDIEDCEETTGDAPAPEEVQRENPPAQQEEEKKDSTPPPPVNENKKANTEDGKVWLTCPVEINNKTPRKPLLVCQTTCPHNKQCDAYAEYMSGQEDGWKEEKGGSGPQPDF